MNFLAFVSYVLLLTFYVFLLALLVSPVVVAVRADLRTGQGYGLALLALALIGLTIFFTVAYVQAPQTTSAGGVSSAFAFFALWVLLTCFWILALLIGALVEAWRAGQWRWIAGLVGAVVLPWPLVLVGHVLDLERILSGITFGLACGLLLGLPTVTILAYGVFRCVRPVQPAATRQAATAR